MRPFHSFIRGGQLVVHGYRMLKQICVVIIGVTLLSGVVVCGMYFFITTTSYQRSLYIDTHIARFKLEVMSGEPSKVTQTFTHPNGRQQEIRVVAFLKNPWVKSHVEIVNAQLKKSITMGLWGALLGVLCVVGISSEEAIGHCVKSWSVVWTADVGPTTEDPYLPEKPGLRFNTRWFSADCQQRNVPHLDYRHNRFREDKLLPHLAIIDSILP